MKSNEKSKFYVSCVGSLNQTIYEKSSGLPPVVLNWIGFNSDGSIKTRIVQ